MANPSNEDRLQHLPKVRGKNLRKYTAHSRAAQTRSDVRSAAERPALPKALRGKAAMIPGNLFVERKQRKVYKVAIAYAVLAWLLMQVASQIFPFFEIPNWAVRLVVLLLIIGFPVAVILAWAFDLTPEGIKRAEDVGPSKSIALKSRNLTARGGGAQRGVAPFTTPPWSVVLEAQGRTPAAQAVTDRLCRTYWRPVYGFVRRRGIGPEEAKDFTQGFFALLLERRDLRTVRKEKGRLRSYLLTSLKHFLATER
jgi:hypothetical protein